MPPTSRKPRGTPSPSKSSSVFAIVGSDESEVKRAAQGMAARLAAKDAGDFGSDVIDGVAENADMAATRIHQTVEAVNTLPFFGGDKLVWLKNANFFGTSIMAKSATVTEASESLIDLMQNGLPEAVKLLISATEIDKSRRFYKALAKIATLEVHERLDAGKSGWEDAAASLIRSKAREHNLEFIGDALELLTLFTGGDSRQIDNEIEKLDLYTAGKRPVTPEDVRLLVPLSRHGVIFEIGNAVAERNLNRCLSLLDQLLHQGESAIGILLVAIIPTVRNLLLIRDLMARFKLSAPAQPFHFTSTLNRLPEDATRHLPRKKDGGINGYALGIAAVHAHRYRVDELRKLHAACLRANLQLVSSQLEPRVVLTQLLGHLAQD